MAEVLSQDVRAISGPVIVTQETETLVISCAALALPSDHAKAVIRGWLELTVPLDTAAVTIAIIAGRTLGGRVVGTKTPEAGDFTVGGTAHFDIEVVDVIDGAGGAQYSMSVQLTGATADGTVEAALIDTTLLSG
jgi:hypothetical protein